MTTTRRYTPEKEKRYLRRRRSAVGTDRPANHSLTICRDTPSIFAISVLRPRFFTAPGDPKNVSRGGKSSSKEENQLPGRTAQSTEPLLEHPISPDEQRGFPRPTQWQNGRERGKEGAVNLELAVVIMVFRLDHSDSVFAVSCESRATVVRPAKCRVLA